MLAAAIDNLRHSVRDLRALLVDLHPPHLAAAGLEAAIRDLVSPLEARGIAVESSVAGPEYLDQAQEALVYRVAQEALRNVVDHARGDRGSRRRDGRAGRWRGSSSPTTAAASRPSERDRRAEEGHLGLSLLEEVARQSGADARRSARRRERARRSSCEVPRR